jgi:mannan endo-1,4-beta-mannosidase
MRKQLIITVLALGWLTCILPIFVQNCSVFAIVPVDHKLTPETEALLYNLQKLQTSKHVLFGQHDAVLYGHSWSKDKNRSDVKDVTGSHPALIGLDYQALTSPDTLRAEAAGSRLIFTVKEMYRQGCVLAFCWHLSNPSNDGSFYWEKAPVKVIPDILPGGKLHEKYKSWLNKAAKVTRQFKGEKGELIPIIFRPFHEFDGDWFWWGKDHCTREEFIALWRFTVEYFRDTLEIHHFLYAFSPDCKFFTEEEYLDYYPGDDYVDIVGFDDYWDFRPDGANDPALALQKMQVVAGVAAKHNKVAALTETGLESVSKPDWFTAELLPLLQQVNVAYVMVWRNAVDLPNHYYTPYPGHPAVDDFKKFYENSSVIFQNTVPDMYHVK